MNRLDALRVLLGDEYSFEVFITTDDIDSCAESLCSEFICPVAAVLSAGCLRIQAVLFRENERVRLGYEVLVKDRPGAVEWICFDSPDDCVSLDEEAMFSVLDKIAQVNGLSYTDCNFDTLSGKTISLKGDNVKKTI